MLMALLLVGAFVVDVGNWQEHRRHLQVQVDDGALAAGTKFTGCYLDPTETNNRIKAEAHRFSGNSAFPTLWGSMFPTEPTPPGPYNEQVDDPTRVQFRQNATTYPPGGTNYVMDYRSPTDDVNGPFHPDGIPEAAEPCAARMIDVKARDIGIPSFFGGLLPSGLNPTDVRAKSRVEIRDVVAMNGFLPWAVPEFAPKSMHAVFVNEASALGAGQTPLAVLPLTRVPDALQPGSLNGEPAILWRYDLDALSVPIVPRTGVIVMVSRNLSPNTTGTLAQICGQAQTNCFSGATPTSGVDFIHGWSDATPGTGQSPVLHDVELSGPGCLTDPSSAPYYTWNGDCDVTVRAFIDFGPDPDPTDPANKPTDKTGDGGIEAKVWAVGPGCPGKGCKMEFVGSGWDGEWQTQTDFPHLPAAGTNNAGRQNFDIYFETATGKDTLTNVHHPYVADDASTFIKSVKVYKPTGPYANSLSVGPKTIRVDVGVEPPLRLAQSASEPPILLRFASKSGSLNQALDCDKAPQTLAEEVRDGCQTFYSDDNPTEDCSAWPGSSLPPNDFGPSVPPALDPNCIAAKTGDVTAMAKGLHDRFEAPCSPNNWETYRSTGKEPPDDDPRYVTLIVTNFAGFSGSGATVVPIRYFAGFYITGYFHMQSANGCTTPAPPDDLPPPPLCASWPNDNGSAGCDPSHNSQKGNVWGYFVTTVKLVPGAKEGPRSCAFDELGACIAILTQ
jgi:hypothetical protein